MSISSFNSLCWYFLHPDWIINGGSIFWTSSSEFICHRATCINMELIFITITNYVLFFSVPWDKGTMGTKPKEFYQEEGQRHAAHQFPGAGPVPGYRLATWHVSSHRKPTKEPDPNGFRAHS
jgi:hypothetical protein